MEGQKIKCIIKCPECERNIPCFFDSYWKCSNFLKHARTHTTNLATNIDQHSANVAANTNKGSSQKYTRARQDILKQVTNVLGNFLNSHSNLECIF